MTERRKPYVIRIGNVIHGLFPESADSPPLLGPVPVRYDAAGSDVPEQQELDLPQSPSTGRASPASEDGSPKRSS